jgi:tRNA pseudouridine65 synthase
VHQVRRHLKHAGHPVIGDATYGHGQLNHALCYRYGLCRLALHAVMLSFSHPTTGQEVTLRASLPPDLVEPLVRMGFGDADLAEAARPAAD